MRKACLLVSALLCCLLLGGCNGGREIEEYLFPVAMGLDASGDGNLTLTVKALSGNEGASGSQDAQEKGGDTGYVTLSATGKDYVQALSLLGATVPRTLNLSQLSEVIVSQTLAQSQAIGPLLSDVLRFYQPNAQATFIVSAGRAQDVIEKQQSYVGTRLSRYLEILLNEYQQKGTIPFSTLLSVERLLADPTIDPVCVNVALNNFDAFVPVPEDDTLDTMPGHLDRQSPNPVEYLGSAVFAKGQMVGHLTGTQTQLLRMLKNDFSKMQYSIDGTEYRIHPVWPAKLKVIERGGAEVLYAKLCLSVHSVSGASSIPTQQIASTLSRDAVALIEKLQSMGADSLGFGRTQMMRCLTLEDWGALNWNERYAACDVQVDVKIAAPGS